MNDERYNYLISANVGRAVTRMAIPAIITMLVTSLYNIADTFFVGQIDTQSTAAVGVVFPVMFVAQAVSFFFGHGSGNYISRELGAKRVENASRMMATGFFYGLGAGVLIMVLGLLFLTPLSVSLGSTPTILPYTVRYLRIILLGTPLLTSSLVLNNQFRLQGYATAGMWGVLSGAILNIILDPIFIFTLDMGVEGAAWATVIGQLCSLAVMLVLTRNGKTLPIIPKHFTPSRAFAVEIVAGGSPSLLRQLLSAVATLLLNVAAAHYGDAAVAAMTIANRICMFIMSGMLGLGQGYQPLCGFCYGAGLMDRVKQGFWFCVRVGTIALLCFTILGFMFTRPIVAVFRDDPAVIAIGIDALRWQLCTFPLCALFIYSNMMMQTCGMTWRANLLASARRGLFFIPLILILPRLFALTGVEMCQAASDLCSFLLCLPILRSALQELNHSGDTPQV